jgi:hypothetical protein
MGGAMAGWVWQALPAISKIAHTAPGRPADNVRLYGIDNVGSFGCRAPGSGRADSGARRFEGVVLS